MNVLYNEFDPKAAAWIRELIALGEIPPGDVDERSILDIQPHEIAHYEQAHFFCGIAGWPLAFRLAGISTGDGKRRWTGSAPCQPFSDAGQQRGTADERHLWPAFFSLIAACGPHVVYGEQVSSTSVVGSSAKPSKRKGARPLEQVWLDGICADLESAHYACGAVDIPAAGIGAPHRRQRLYWLADRERPRLEGHTGNGNHGDEPGRERAHEVGSVAASGGAGADRMGEPDRAGSQPGRQAASSARHGDSAESAGDDGEGLGDSARGGCGEQRHEAQPGHSGHPERADRARLGPWHDFTIIPCRDGKARRIESGTFPLVDGLPRGVVHRRDPSVPINAKATAEARQMRLKGYGNAIVPELAAQFILACEEALTT